MSRRVAANYCNINYKLIDMVMVTSRSGSDAARASDPHTHDHHGDRAGAPHDMQGAKGAARATLTSRS